jgi:hypothetical protein
VATYEGELEQEFEQELQEFHEGEGETTGAGLEGEGELGAIASAIGGLFGEGEDEGEFEMNELPELHEFHEFEGEGELAHEFEGEGEFESGEHFFKGFGKLFKKALPVLKRVAKVAAPIVARAIGGPVLGTVVDKVAGALEGELGEFGELHEFGEVHEAHELDGEFESEVQGEGEAELAHEITQHEITSHEMEAEIMAHEAAQESHELEAEAMAGVAAITVISPRERRALRRILPHMIRGTAILTRILRRRRITRPFVRTVPGIMRQTMRALRRHTAAGRPLTRQLVARTTANQVRRVLGNPRVCASALSRNIRTTRAAQRHSGRRYRPVAG